MAKRSPDDAGAAASDPAVMKRVLADRLRKADGSAVEVLACDIAFARVGGARSLFQYRLVVGDPAGGEPRSLDVSAVGYGGGRTARVWERLARRLPPAAAHGFAPAAYAPELDLLLQVFPFDHQMPALAAVLAGPWPPLAEALLVDFGPGAWRVAGWTAETVRYRVDLRATVRLELRAEDAATGEVVARRCYAKLYANPALAERAWQVQRDLEAALAVTDGALGVAPIAAWLPDERVLVQREAPGVGLPAAVADPARAEAAVRLVARAVAMLHGLPIAAPTQAHDLDRVGPDRVRRNADRLRASRPDLADRVDAVEAGILAAFAASGADPGAPVHGDLKPDHLLLDGERVILLDFDKFAAGDPLLDVVNLARTLRGGRRDGPEWTGGGAGAFVAEYLAHAPADWRRRLAPNAAAALLADAAKVGRQVRGAGKPNRRRDAGDRAADLLGEAQAALADGAG